MKTTGGLMIARDSDRPTRCWCLEQPEPEDTQRERTAKPASLRKETMPLYGFQHRPELISKWL